MIQSDFNANILAGYYQENFYAFVKDWFKEIKGNDFRFHWSVEYICEHIEANIKGDIERLIVSLPRGWGKSIFISEFASAWALLRDPTERIGCYSRALTEDSKLWHRNALSIMQHKDIIGLFNKDRQVSNASALIFRTNKKGYRKIGSCLSSSVGSDLTFAIVDDPVDQEYYRSEAKQTRIHNFFTKSLFRAIRTVLYEDTDEYMSQLTDLQKKEYELMLELEKEQPQPHKKPRMLLTMQRLSANDPVNMLIDIEKRMQEQKLPSNFKYVSIPSLSTQPKEYIFPITNKVYTTQEQEYLLAGTLSQKSILKAKIEMLPEDFEAQMQQNPMERQGAFFKREWFNYVDDISLMRFESIYISIDSAFKTKEYNDPTAIVVFGLSNNKNNVYVIDCLTKRLEFHELEKFVMDLINKYKQKVYNGNIAVIIEDKGSGQSLIQNLKRSVGNIIKYNPQGGKEERLQRAITSMRICLESGGFYLPKYATWRADYENELISFPNGVHDDMVDATSQFFDYIKKSRITVFDVL